MNKVTLNGREFNVAGALNELSAPQLLKLTKLIHSGKPVEHVLKSSILILLQVRRNLYLQWLFFWHLKLEELEYLLLELEPICGFLFRKSTLTKQLLPKIRIPGTLKWLYGPADLLGNCSFLEYIKAEAAYLGYHRTRDQRYLNRLVAILYRPRNRAKETADTATGDTREKFNEALLERRTKQVARLPLATRQAIMLFFVGCRQQIVERHREVFPEPEQGVTEQRRAANLGWAGILKQLAGSIKDYEPTGAQNIHTVLFHMKASILEEREREAKAKSSK
ncbi:hypothetical protein EFA69_16265 [Rufibacter immobilis]|uniref:Uncharacterized protein n=1 Tax=Rufibacter immobilis TaxID=1348778 RepID=A0A3M9MQ62_9BACT|nr:hypothetical protein [Rufibacter immobilis]RNI27672.1 hypothetical protein EFA69_16265 [Rufibacter immobilis]